MKKKVLLKRFLAGNMALLMTVGLLTGCGAKDDKQETGKSTESTVESTKTSESTQASESTEQGFVHDELLNEPGVEPLCKEKVRITIGLQQNANVENYDTNHYTQLLEEMANVDIEFVLLPAGGEGEEKLRMMMTGNQELPDIIFMGFSDAQAMTYGDEGYFIPLEDYFENSLYYANDVFDRAKEQNGLDIVETITMTDGHIWSFPNYLESPNNAYASRTWIYGPWLEAVDMEVPTTVDEFYEVLKAFKTKDPNGNGKADEIPFLGSDPIKNANGSQFYAYLMNAYVHTTSGNNFLISTDGKLSVAYNTEEWKEGVKGIRKFVDEGLLDGLSFTQDQESFKAAVNSAGDQIVGCFSYLSDSFVPADHPSKGDWILLEPLTGPNGFISTAYKPDIPGNKAFITADCEHPEIAFKLLDLMCKQELVITNRWGEQGVNWDYVEDLKKNPDFKDRDFGQTYAGYPALFLEYNSVWNKPGNANWQNRGVGMGTLEITSGSYAAALDPENHNSTYWLAQKLDTYIAARPEEGITKVKYTTVDEQIEAETIQNELNEYVFSKLAAWSTRVSDIDAEWDAYLKELEEIGLSRYLELSQKGWK